MSSGCAAPMRWCSRFPVWNYGYPAILKGFFDRVFLPGVSFELVNGKAQPSLHNIRKVAAVTTYGGSRFRAMLMGDPPRKLVKRLMRATVKPGAPVSYLAHYSMNLSTDQYARSLHAKVAASDGRVLMRCACSSSTAIRCRKVFARLCATRRSRRSQAAGSEVRLIDLYAERFDPVMRADERRSYNDARARRSRLEPHIEHLHWAEAILFVYPTWWYGLPAMLKGWFDRVWAKDVAFTLQDGGRITPLMTHIRKIGIVTTCGAPRWWSWLDRPARPQDHPARHPRALRQALQDDVSGALPDGRSTPETRAAFLGEVRRKGGGEF